MSLEPEHAILDDSHVETATLRRFAPGVRCAVVGAYKGATMRYLLEHGASYVVGVEPQKWAYNRAVANLLSVVPKLGPWELDCVALVPWETAVDGSSLVTLYDAGTDMASFSPRERGPGVVGDVAEVTAYCIDEWVKEYEGFDFTVMNCEGSEYFLFEKVAAISKVILVQFHGPPMSCPLMSNDGWIHLVRTFVGKGWWLYE